MKYLLILLLPCLAFGQSNHHNNEGGANVTQGDFEIVGGTFSSGSSTAIGYGPDNDINDCMAHWSVLIVTFPKRNKFCERLEFVRWAEHPGTHTPQSIKIMCSGDMGQEVFDTTQECVTIFTPKDAGTANSDDTGEVSKEKYKDPELRNIVQTRIEQHTEEYEGLEQRLNRIESGQRVAAQKSQERRDYAQQTIQRLEDESENE